MNYVLCELIRQTLTCTTDFKMAAALPNYLQVLPAAQPAVGSLTAGEEMVGNAAEDVRRSLHRGGNGEVQQRSLFYSSRTAALCDCVFCEFSQRPSCRPSSCHSAAVIYTNRDSLCIHCSVSKPELRDIYNASICSHNSSWRFCSYRLHRPKSDLNKRSFTRQQSNVRTF